MSDQLAAIQARDAESYKYGSPAHREDVRALLALVPLARLGLAALDAYKGCPVPGKTWLDFGVLDSRFEDTETTAAARRLLWETT